MQKSFLSSMFGMKFMLDHSLSLHNFVKTICTDFVIEMDHDILIEAKWLLWLTLKSDNNKQKMSLHLLLTSNHTWWWLQLLLRVGQRRMSTVIQFFLRNLIFRFLTNMYQASTHEFIQIYYKWLTWPVSPASTWCTCNQAQLPRPLSALRPWSLSM